MPACIGIEVDVRAVVQRVTRASVRVDAREIAAIDGGLLVLVGVAADDGPADAKLIADKVATLRVFADDDGVMNRSVVDVGGAVLAVSQFTLHGDVRRGRRPSYVGAARPEVAEPLYRSFVEAVRVHGLPVQEGRFQAMMEVELVNDGPVTILLDSKKAF